MFQKVAYFCGYGYSLIVLHFCPRIFFFNTNKNCIYDLMTALGQVSERRSVLHTNKGYVAIFGKGVK